MDVYELQTKIVAERRDRGFVTDPLKLHVLLTEEVGEVAGELKRLWSSNYPEFDRARLADEVADVFCALVALANEFDIDIEAAVEYKFFVGDRQRTWVTASQQDRPPAALVDEAGA
jgi:NTP pyrophosphatase (non-canonical NTP hydrolase)